LLQRLKRKKVENGNVRIGRWVVAKSVNGHGPAELDQQFPAQKMMMKRVKNGRSPTLSWSFSLPDAPTRTAEKKGERAAAGKIERDEIIISQVELRQAKNGPDQKREPTG
jgi:hypothetical protein